MTVLDLKVLFEFILKRLDLGLPSQATFEAVPYIRR